MKKRTIKLLQDTNQSHWSLLRHARKIGDTEVVNNFVLGRLKQRGIKFETVD